MNLVENSVLLRLSLRPLILAMFLALSIVAGANAATPTTPCDPDYWNSMAARAYIEAEREVANNQNLIYKPDSVLQYTCFDKFLGAIGQDSAWSSSGGPFSDSTRWGTITGQPANGLKDNLQAIVEASVNTYLTKNFDNKYLATRDTDDAVYTGDATLTGAAYSCDQMTKVWEVAQCSNMFNSKDEAQNNFWDFPHYTTDGNDPRQYPTACKADTVISGAIADAFNNKNSSYTLTSQTDWSKNYTAYIDDPVVTHFDLIMPVDTKVGANGTQISCDTVKPIPTGVCVIRAGWSTVYGDAICPNPGCHYVAPGKEANGVPDASGCTGTLQINKCEGSTTTTPPP